LSIAAGGAATARAAKLALLVIAAAVAAAGDARLANEPTCVWAENAPPAGTAYAPALALDTAVTAAARTAFVAVCPTIAAVVPAVAADNIFADKLTFVVNPFTVAA
jgi:hypothetical protein